ncbi:MAG: hypothetical protein IT204_15900 [Fimbriimonadaceae bacterium]|nr:hypothetical protein [Fimbriimonadaceae bacterium]
MRHASLLLLLCGCLGGCAKFPAGLSGGEARQLLDLRLTLRAAVDENAYYLFGIDINGRDGDGPEVIAPFTEFLGNGRATGSYTHYVEYHQRQFELFRDQPEQQGTTVPPRTALGPPIFFDSTSSAGTLSCSVDLAQLRLNAADPNPTQLELNFITVNQIVLPGEIPLTPRQSDGFGTLGTTFLSIRAENGLVINNDGIESGGELFGGQQLDGAYDLTDFRIAIRQGS